MSVLDRTPPKADVRIAYGTLPDQFGELWLPPAGAGAKHPLAVFVHGGWWRSEYDLSTGNELCLALKHEGYAVWSIEYRRVGATGGGWPATFGDVAAGFDHAAVLGRSYPLDLTRVVALGHSAGGHLAFWLAGRHHIPHESPLASPGPQVALRGVIGLAGALDLRLTADLAGYTTFAHDKREVYALMGGSPEAVPDRYRVGNPGDLLPFNVPQAVIQGTEDGQIPPELPTRWAAMARGHGDEVEVLSVPGADHFDVIDPGSAVWPVLLKALRRLAAG